MRALDRLQQIKELQFDTEVPIHSSGGIDVYILRPSKPPKRFNHYDVNKNFQIWLREGERQFKPNHLRVFIDLYLRSRSTPTAKTEILKSFDSIFYGQDPIIAIKNIKKLKFEHYLNPIEIVATLSQLFIIEQEYSYHKKSKYSPSSLFYQGWIRQVIWQSKEIDNICMSIANGNPPAVSFTRQDDKNHKKFVDNREALWYTKG